MKLATQLIFAILLFVCDFDCLKFITTASPLHAEVGSKKLLHNSSKLENKNRARVEERYEERPLQLTKLAEKHYFQDFLIRHAGPGMREFAFGHVASMPGFFQKQFESYKRGKRYKGEITWTDQAGAYETHHWDMAVATR